MKPKNAVGIADNTARTKKSGLRFLFASVTATGVAEVFV
jgi:hypothetical protein